MGKREFERKHLNVSCVVRYVSLDGRSVERVVGTTLDVSRGGIGIRAKLSLRRHTPVHLCLTLRERKTANFTGVITYSRAGDQGQYLLGVQFCKIDDERVAQMLDRAGAHEAATGSDEIGTTSVKEPEAHVGVGKPHAIVSD